MPFFRRFKKKRQTVDKRLKKLERNLAIELKYDIFSNFNATDGNSLNIASASAVKRMTDIAQGTNAIDRVGNKIHVKYIDYKLAISNAQDGPVRVRLIVFYWNSDTAPTVTDVILNPVAGAGVPDEGLQPINQSSVSNKNMYVFYDKMHIIEGDSLASGSRLLNLNKRFKINRNQYYNDTAGSNLTKGVYYLLYNSLAPAAPNVTQAYDECKTTFTDA